MRRSAQVAAPLLAAASLSLLLGCDIAEPCMTRADTTACISGSTSEASRAGFGSSFGLLVIPGIVLVGWWMNKKGIGG
jgi:hypothetical protein